jgi:outer membrane lipoprotein-sorting protein
MNTPTEDHFRESYTVYERNHAQQREAMLAALPQAAAVKRRLNLRPAFAAFAAVLIVALGIASFEAIRATPAYGLDGLRERLQTLNSWHIKGYYFKQTKTQFGIATLQFPIERYYQRPSRNFHTGYGFGSQGNDNLVQVTRSYTVSDGQRSLLVLYDQKKAVLTTAVDPLQTELSIESEFQVNEIEQLMSRDQAEYDRVGTERLDGKWCDIYQSKPRGALSFWRRIWIDPSNGLPVRVKGFRRESNDEDVPDYEYTEIRTNDDPPPELFSFEVPAGYELTEVAEAPKVRYVSPAGSCGGGNYRAANWIGINIDDRAVLVCWSQWLQEKDKRTFFHDKPQIVLEGSPDRRCTEQTLYETISDDLRWRWSLVVPEDKKPLENKSLAIKFEHPKASISLSLYPLVFSEPRLSEMVEKVQRRSLEAAGDFSNVKSLKQLRESISNGTKTSQP